ncbi:zinc finger HIT domain-containing protein 3 [Schistocerca americana]|uniref:zinc finger HIT domain-containing protein 3 n=1 Tax=Schistocerca americana TaxID=7009 RepID=UPI001F4FFB09|nr:zinc finger HIT domain-containing protein 3 [Schistocerca americana]XP_047115127.1 zinc finger HIT domain-containing protein 3 [Schistocerca piceifrons]XP_049784871.1 zinc finger HIT domain-containing protein 3-like [Schistocerca cancellata]XP_049812666.1 zinc finger HIT domain-containing protein 3-like [Schistocerca nitens]XP_049827542.1 zinc finger HIT domain-containing protein 3 [Schistocerca gregaria]XP_049960810.1 zinc finger HIT domain-containing protein 3 [Schistocerca serialis cuben
MTIVCNVCELGKSKYKCPECLISYCSLDCWKTHKSSTTCKPVVYRQVQRRLNLVSAAEENAESTSEDAVAKEKLQALAESDELKDVLKNHELREMLIAIDKSKFPSQAIQAAMMEPMFVEFADICLKIVEPPAE